MTHELTSTQARVLAFMHQFFLANDQLPTNQGIADHFGWASTNAANDHVQALARKGSLVRNSVGGWKFSDAARPGQGVTA